MTLSPLDLVIILAYVAFVATLGGVLGGKQKDASDYFLADHAAHQGMAWSARK